MFVYALLFFFPRIFIRFVDMKYGLSGDPSFRSQSSTEKKEDTVNVFCNDNVMNKHENKINSDRILTEAKEQCINSHCVNIEEYSTDKVSGNAQYDGGNVVVVQSLALSHLVHVVPLQ